MAMPGFTAQLLQNNDDDLVTFPVKNLGIFEILCIFAPRK